MRRDEKTQRGAFPTSFAMKLSNCLDEPRLSSRPRCGAAGQLPSELSDLCGSASLWREGPEISGGLPFRGALRETFLL